LYRLTEFLWRLIRVGRLTVIDPEGKAHVYGGAPGPAATIRIHDRATCLHIIANPRLKIGESYMDGRLTIEAGTIYDFLELVLINLDSIGTDAHRPALISFLDRLNLILKRAHQYNPAARSRSNVAHHYDLSGQLYDLFLDADRQYSCAYFASDADSLETAQDNKKRHIAAKLLLKPGARVLDIGSGWGGLGLYLAGLGAGEVTGVTLSEEQHRISNDRAAAAGLGDRVRFKLQDYRAETGRYDRIVSVGMFEHVGVGHYHQFFSKVKELLTDDGVCLLHSIGRMDPPAATNAWLRKYIFPGGYSPALSEVLPVVEKVGLWVTDIEILRLHSATTLGEWCRRFAARRDEVRAIYDERFCRMWEFYLAGSELAFRHQGHLVFQMQLARRQDAVPLTRDYITDWERAHGGRGIRAA